MSFEIVMTFENHEFMDLFLKWSRACLSFQLMQHPNRGLADVPRLRDFCKRTKTWYEHNAYCVSSMIGAFLDLFLIVLWTYVMPSA